MTNDEKIKQLGELYVRSMASITTLKKKLTQIENDLAKTYNDIFGTQSLFEDSPPPPSKPKSIYSKRIREMFIEFFEKEKGITVKRFNAKDNTAVLRIIKKIQEQIDVPIKELEEEEYEGVYNIFGMILGVCKRNKWIMSNFSVGVVDTQMLKLLADLKGSTGSKDRIINKLKS